MFSTLMTVFRGRVETARENLECSHAATLIEQKIREAEAGHDRAKRALASLILRERTEGRALDALTARINDVEARTRGALDAGMDDLARDGAQALADMENERAVRSQALARTTRSAERLRHMIDQTERRLVDLRQGLLTAKSIQAEHVSARDLSGDLGSIAAVVEGEKVLNRLLDSPDPVEAQEILDNLDRELTGDAMIDRFAEAGLGERRKADAGSILDRLKSSIATPNTAEQGA